jgi:hypothetical protein
VSCGDVMVCLVDTRYLVVVWCGVVCLVYA